ncbi:MULTISPECIES: LexA family transcriptional regulator [unclassified Pseudomonas]|uniref:LexA family protein n=1 Tax=unclassified Pseudomonas TaxID=196821 RepID=UPI000BD275A1|nr:MULTISPECIES: translesion error-prone DNA polymerase V autoproteolytic subunit [unclassified Pseudomonas]PVZ19543.1 DNA polymerase V [Pseudomonas sp. URIL14HWK12:I12]PVZ22872.1 DNA polymerase V [Pseudomonas sp. URIL14HWK12:I10]PVZ37498.1 DNA polymerase V [Pseudomonas sp. URIL14HWK12:I11]SNZ14927.1 DNA polymerase V [Pseudomonas sp. URIL14HWK12:I9]
MITTFGPVRCGALRLPVYSFRVPAGFPSPATDHLDQAISLDELFRLRAPSIYLVRIEGDSMIGAGIHDGDLLIVDRAIEPAHGQIVIAAVNGEPLCKRLHRQAGEVALMSENRRFPPRYILDGDELQIWGVVTFSVRDHDRHG